MFPATNFIQHDDVCLICDKWIEDATDKLRFWKECPHCPQAYHSNCIPAKTRYSHRQLTCTEYFKGSYTKNDGHEYKCCNRSSREAQLLCNPKEKPIQIVYYRTINGRKTVPVSKHEREPNKRYFRQKKYFSLYWKNVSFGSGECVYVKMVDGQHKIARIKEIFLDEEDAIPHVVLSWVVTEENLEAHLLNKYKTRSLSFELPNASKTIYKPFHVYFDLNDEDTVSIETIESKVLVIETFEEFRDLIQTNWKSEEYSRICYGKWCYDSNYGVYPFKLLKEALVYKPKAKKIGILSLDNLRRHDDEYGKRKKSNFNVPRQQNHHSNNRKINKRSGPPKLEKMNNRMDTDQKTNHPLPNYRIPKRRNHKLQRNKDKKRKREPLNEPQSNKKRKIEDSSSIPEDSSNYSDEEVEIENSHNKNTNNAKPMTRHAPKKQRKTKTPKKKILENNKKKYDQNEMDQMNDICRRLNLGKGPKIGVNLYHFQSHVEVYKAIDFFFKVTDSANFEGYINGKVQAWCRDVKTAMYTKGPVTPLVTMKANIVQRFRELKPNYQSAQN